MADDLDRMADDGRLTASHVPEDAAARSPYGDGTERLVVETFATLAREPHEPVTYLVRIRNPELGYATGHWVRVDASWRLRDVLGAPLPAYYLRALSGVLERRARAMA